MHIFKKVLFVCRGHAGEKPALQQALSIARNNSAQLLALVVCPEFPPQMQDHAQIYEKALRDKVEADISEVGKDLSAVEAAVSVSVAFVKGGGTAAAIIGHAISQSCDLVIKDADPDSQGLGFARIDMELLRKCPVPVWLCRPIVRHRNQIRVAVAIDSQQQTDIARNLSLRLLRLARALADDGSGELTVISCHNFEFEEFVKDTAYLFVNTGPKIGPAKVVDIAEQDMCAHRTALDTMITEADIGGRLDVQHVRGRPEYVIPRYVREKDIDILVMGTVARTGVAELLIGNTAESIVGGLNCSLVAMKPEGFISPVRAR